MWLINWVVWHYLVYTKKEGGAIGINILATPSLCNFAIYWKLM
jgi:hypothetical protein